MNALDGKINVIEQLMVVLDRHAGAEKDHDLLLPILLEEGEQN